MDDRVFDGLTKSLLSPAHRRAALRTLLGGVLGVAEVRALRAATTKECVPACSECADCQKGICKKKRGRKKCKPGQCIPKQNGIACSNNPCTECQSGACVNKANDTTCPNSGRCLNGTCNPPPTCQPFGTPCVPGTAVCCGPICVPTGPFPAGACLTPAASGAPCIIAPDCVSGSCVGFRCQ